MKPNILIEMMGEETAVSPESFLLWRCLHSGPYTRDSIECWAPDEQMPWATFRARNLPLLQKLTRTYESCAVTAWDEQRVVGMLRFYPKAICAMPAAGMLCLQQDFPFGPANEFWKNEFPAMQELADKTLAVHCMMTGCPNWKENPYQRQGIGARLVRRLVDWGREKGWAAIEATAYEDIPILYNISGQAGKAFWGKAGFAVAETTTETAFQEDNDFTRELRQQASAMGLSPQQMERKYTMRLVLS